MHAGFAAMNPQLLAEDLADVLLEDGAALAVHGAHASDVSREMSRVDELRQNGLVEIGRRDVDALSDGDEAIHQVWRHNHVSESKRREQHFATSADVDNPFVAVESL